MRYVLEQLLMVNVQTQQRQTEVVCWTGLNGVLTIGLVTGIRVMSSLFLLLSVFFSTI